MGLRVDTPALVKLRPFDLRVGEWVKVKPSYAVQGNTSEEEKEQERKAHYRVTHISNRVFTVDRYVYDRKTRSYRKSVPTSFMKLDYMQGYVNRVTSDECRRETKQS